MVGPDIAIAVHFVGFSIFSDSFVTRSAEEIKSNQSILFAFVICFWCLVHTKPGSLYTAYTLNTSGDENYCLAWSRLKLNTKIGLNHHHHPPPQTFRTVLGIVGG